MQTKITKTKKKHVLVCICISIHHHTVFVIYIHMRKSYAISSSMKIISYLNQLKFKTSCFGYGCVYYKTAILHFKWAI